MLGLFPICELKNITISTHLFFPSLPSHPLTNELQGDHDQVLSAIVWNNSLFCEVKVRLLMSEQMRHFCSALYFKFVQCANYVAPQVFLLQCYEIF